MPVPEGLADLYTEEHVEVISQTSQYASELNSSYGAATPLAAAVVVEPFDVLREPCAVVRDLGVDDGAGDRVAFGVERIKLRNLLVGAATAGEAYAVDLVGLPQACVCMCGCVRAYACTGACVCVEGAANRGDAGRELDEGKERRRATRGAGLAG